MTTSLQMDPRRTARDAFRKPGRPPLEMPVLFQLADLSLHQAKDSPKVLSNPPVPAVVDVPAAIPESIAPQAPIVETAPAIEPAKVEVPKEATPAPKVSAAEAPKLEVPQVKLPPVSAALSAIAKASTETEPKAEVSIAEGKTADSQVSVPAASPEIAPSATDVTPPQEPNAPSPRARKQQRASHRQPTPAKSDWMRTHGKFIAVGFVFALIATIYMAQNGDEPAPANPGAAANAHKETAAKSPSESEPKVTDAHTAKESVSTNEHQHSPGLLDEANPAKSPAEPHTDLNAPTSGHVIKEPSQPSEVADTKSLFPWKEAGETRVAAKPEGAKPQAEAKTHEQNAIVKEEPSVYGPPGSGPQEEEVQQATGEMPQGKIPGSYPETNSGTYRDFVPPPGRSAPAPTAPSQRAAPASYQPGPPNNVPPTRTSGPRYERTGSGLY